MSVTRPLWTIEVVAAATGGSVSGADAAISGVAIDSREVRPGDLFVAQRCHVYWPRPSRHDQPVPGPRIFNVDQFTC